MLGHLWQDKFMEQEQQNQHAQIMMELGTIKGGIDGTNRRLDNLNSSVAKHEMRLASQDILNAQMTITQSEIVKEIASLKDINKDKQTNGKVWLDRIIWSFVVPAVSFLIILALTKLGIVNLK